jgi:hypothetical protein
VIRRTLLDQHLPHIAAFSAGIDMIRPRDRSGRARWSHCDRLHTINLSRVLL